MRRLRRSFALLFPWLAALLLAPQLAAEPSPVFKSMRVAALIDYLEDRGEKCEGCVEKADFVRRCKEVWERTATKASEKPKHVVYLVGSLPPAGSLDPAALLGPFEQRTGGIINSRRSFQRVGDPKTRMWHEPPDWVVGSATGVPSLRVWDDAITPEQIQEEWTAWNGTDWIYVSLLVLDGEDGRYTWQEQVEAPQRALKAAAARVFVTGRPPRGQHASKLGPFVRRGAEGGTEGSTEGGDVPLVGGRHSYVHASDESVVMWHAAPPSGAAGRWWIGQRKDLAQRRGFVYAVSEAFTPEAIEASARWMVFQPRAKAWREWPQGRDGPRCLAGDEGRKAWEHQQQQQEKYAASDSGGGRGGGRGGGGGGGHGSGSGSGSGSASSSCDAAPTSSTLPPPPPSTPPQPQPEPTWAPRVSSACAGAPDDEAACLEAVTSLQRALSAEGATMVTSSVEIGALPDLVRLLEHAHDELVLQAASCLTNLASDPNPTLP